MRGVIYARYSSTNQNEMSIEAQVRACTEYAEKQKINIIKIYKDEAISGTTNKRNGYQSLLADAMQDQFEVILIHKYDRIARDLAEQVTLDRKLKALNIDLIAVAQNYGTGKDANLSKGIQWVLGEYYSANLAEETRKGLKETFLKGKFTGGIAPFGYDIKYGKYVINELEAAYVRLFFQYCIAGQSYTPLLSELSKAGIKGKRGKDLKYPQIYEMLHNEKYAGIYKYCPVENKNREDRRNKKDALVLEGVIPPIITKGTFDKAQEIMQSRKHVGQPTRHRCSGLVYCECGGKMYINTSTSKGHTYKRFRCKECNKYISFEKIDLVTDAYLEHLLSPELKEEIESILYDYKLREKDEFKAFKEEQKKKIDEKEKAINNIMQFICSGSAMDNADYINQQLSQLRSELEAIKNMRPPEIPSERIKDWLYEVRQNKTTPAVFIDKLIVSSNDEIQVISTFAEVVGNLGCGGLIDILNTTFYPQCNLFSGK